MALKIPSPQNWKKRLQFLLKHKDYPNRQQLIEQLAERRAIAEMKRPGASIAGAKESVLNQFNIKQPTQLELKDL